MTFDYDVVIIGAGAAGLMCAIEASKRRRRVLVLDHVRKLAEKINVINNVESGKRPTDAVIRKLERTLDIKLMIDAAPDENRHVNTGNARGLTLGDFLLGGKE